MKIEVLGEDGAVEALEAVLKWCALEPDSKFEGGHTGRTYQRGRVVATRVLPENTVGISTYNSEREARDKAEEMDEAYKNWLRLRGGRRLGGKR